jgi:hypothetical protein
MRKKHATENTRSGGMLPAGGHALVWDGTNTSGRATGSGVYVVELHAGPHLATGKVTLVT